MHNPEKYSGSESAPHDLREQLESQLSEKFEAVTIEDRKTAEQNPDKNFRIRLGSDPSKLQLKTVDEAIINFYQKQYDAELKRDEKSSGSNQRAIELSGEGKRIVIIRTNHNTNIEITTKVTQK